MEDGRQGSSVADEYRSRLAARRAESTRRDRQHERIAWARLSIFLAGVAIVVVLGRASAPWLALPLVAFVTLLFVHARILNARDRTARAVLFYERGLARIEDRWQGTGDRGERFRDPGHLYSEDLDLFGPGGLFELLVASRTGEGEDVLANWLLAPADPGTVRERQQAVAELAPRLDLREDLSVLGPDLPSTVRTSELKAWAAAPPQLPQGRWPRIALPIVAAFSTILIVRWIWTAEPPDLLLPVLAVQTVLALRFRHGVHHVAHGVTEREQELRVLATLMERIERERFESSLLNDIQARLRRTGRSPADEVRQLAHMVEIVSSGHNQIFAPIAALLLLGTQMAFAVEAWRRRCGPAVPIWLAAVAESEALAAVGGFAAEHPTHAFPDVREGEPYFEAADLRHPLLPSTTAVPNDVSLGGSHPHLLLVSGSNMSGKSTLLRTVGLNAVLAQAGAPVSAVRLAMTPLRIGGTLRIQDSLQAGRSRFFAEITRISEIVALASQTRTGVLFLLDELLSGTNSHDRLQGAAGILRGLVNRGAIGMATTHDLALTRVAETLGGIAMNVHFEDRFAAGTLTFDYRLKPGVVQSSNAIALMRAVGLDV